MANVLFFNTSTAFAGAAFFLLGGDVCIYQKTQKLLFLSHCTGYLLFCLVLLLPPFLPLFFFLCCVGYELVSLFLLLDRPAK